ncbi:ArsR/SmtB family transcription factor [Nakamurella lactea]|uniref:ArsR/SmtB family transcription factor n=1 Tax=Nakamurella lactea TaxID=459515 RepID=UPI00040D97B4|nr:winged helix-turn-helix domain-containing protein [Nakamurella lactea]
MVKYDDGLDGAATALAHRGRRQIISRLGAGSATSSELAELLDIGLPALHKHLDLLRRASLIESSKTGRTVSHVLRPAGLDQLADWLLTRKSFWSNQFDALADHLETS